MGTTKLVGDVNGEWLPYTRWYCDPVNTRHRNLVDSRRASSTDSVCFILHETMGQPKRTNAPLILALRHTHQLASCIDGFVFMRPQLLLVIFVPGGLSRIMIKYGVKKGVGDKREGFVGGVMEECVIKKRLYGRQDKKREGAKKRLFNAHSGEKIYRNRTGTRRKETTFCFVHLRREMGHVCKCCHFERWTI